MVFEIFVERILNRILSVIVISFMFGMLVVIFTSVLCRFLLNFSPTWAEELARYLMIWVCFLGGPLAVGIGGHVGVQLFMARVPFGIRKIVRILTIVCIEVFLIIVAKKGYDLILMILTQESPALRIPMVYVYAAVPVGCILLFVEFLYALVKGPKEGDYTPFAMGGET